MRKIGIVYSIAIISTITAAVFATLHVTHGGPHRGTTIIRDKNKQPSLINPILDCEIAQSGEESVISRDLLNSAIATVKQKYDVRAISLYYRDLNNGPWVGVGEKDFFSPASLLKTPLYIAFLRYVQDVPSIANQKVTVVRSDEVPSVQMIKPQKTVIPGESYTLQELAEFSIKYSDNIATATLSKYIPLQYINDVYSAIGADYDGPGDELQVRVKDFASFFRILYNASYLDRDSSQHALEVLSQTTYRSGIVAGVPGDVVISSKFGERGDVNDQNKSQLHDCGIVYHKTNPYILCVMTRGGDLSKQQSAIAALSRFIYDEVNK